MRRRARYYWFVFAILVVTGIVLLLWLPVSRESKSIAVEFVSLVLLGAISLEAWFYSQKAHIDDVRQQFLAALTENCAKITAACSEISSMYLTFSMSQRHASKVLTAIFSPQAGVMHMILLSAMLRQVAKLHEAKFALDLIIEPHKFRNDKLQKLNDTVSKIIVYMNAVKKEVDTYAHNSGRLPESGSESPPPIMSYVTDIKASLLEIESELGAGKLDEFLLS